MTTAVIALAAAAAALLAVGLVWLAGVRARRATDTRLGRSLDDLQQRMEALSTDISAALSHVEDVSRRQRALGDLSTTLDLDEVLARTAEAAAVTVGADASVAHTTAHDGSSVVASVGLPQEVAGDRLVSGPPDGSAPRAIELAYRYDMEGESAGSISSGLAIPLKGEDAEPLGYVAVYARGDRPLGRDALAALESLAFRAGPSVGNARRYREARQLADTDALTGLHNRRMFHETLAREVARAQRYARNLALIVLDLDDFKQVNDRFGHLAGDAVLGEVGERLRAVARSADVPCRIGGEEFGVILPESSVGDAEALYQRLVEAISARPIDSVGPVRFSAGLAELRVDDDAISFFERADRALYDAKRAGKGRAVPHAE